MRIACVQNGNFTLARRVLSAGGDETYKGQRYTVNGFLRFVKGLPHVVISLDAPPHREASDEGEYLAVPAPPSASGSPGASPNAPAPPASSASSSDFSQPTSYSAAMTSSAARSSSGPSPTA